MGYSELPADIRARHPFHMYDEIKAQPEAISRSLALAADRLDDLAGIISRARRVYLTGCGTSFHAAQVGAWMLNGFSRGSVDAHAVQAFELVTYTRDLGSRDVVVALSHSGSTHMTNRALERANQIGAATIAVTGFPEKASGKLARFTLPTGYPDERSWAHTVSYTAALTSLAAVANHLAHPDERVDLSPLPGVVADVLGLEEVVHNTAAAALRDRDRSGGVPIMLIGAGPNAATASEGVLKLLETSYCAALAFELEQALHGPLAALDTDSVVMIIAPPGKSQERAVSLAAAVRC
ncbi:MAG: SIS domain-containing protein, partial [Chloroflexota bacterium]